MFRRLPILALSVALLAVSLGGAPSVATAQDGDNKLRLLLGQGWTFMEHGNLNQAEASFTEAFGLAEGPNTAEAYYALAAVWWERRNAMAAYMWLTDATTAAKKSYTWNGGADLDWDRRISARRRFIEGNFTVVKLRSPARGKPVPPLADPPPGDPTLAQFSALLPKVVADGVAAKVAVQWVMIPNGTYWIGDKLVSLDSGELDASEARSWDLLQDRGKARKTYAHRLRELSEGRSPASAAADRQATDALAREEQRRQLEADRLEAELRREEEAAQARAELERRRVENRQQLEEERLAKLEEERVAEAEAEARLRERERKDSERLEAETRRADAERLDAERREREAAEEAALRAERERLQAEEQETQRAQEEVRKAEENARRAEADRLAVQRREEKRAEAERADEERKRAKERQAAAAAETKRRELASKEAEAGEDRRARREELVKSRSQGKASKSDAKGTGFLARKFFFAGAVGPALVNQIEEDGERSRAEWSASGEFGGLIAIRGAPLSVALAVSYANLPVSGCSAVQTRSSVLSLHAGVRVPVQLRDRIWFAFRGGMHVVGGGSWPSPEARASCGAAKLSADEVLYGVRLQGESGSGRLSYAALAWNGYSLALGPDLDATVFFGLGAQPGYIGVGFFLRHDQLLAAVRPDSYHFEIDGSSSPDLETVQLGYFDPQASMARLQLGFRATLVF